MQEERYVRKQTVTVKKCEWCNKSHTFPVEVLFDTIVDTLGFFTIRTEEHDVILTCPDKGKNIVVSVPMTFSSMESFVSINARE